MSTVYDMAKSGMSIAEIAEELSIAENTVRQAITNKWVSSKQAEDQRDQFAQLYPQFKELLTTHMARDPSYVPPTKAKNFVSASIDECAAMYSRDLANGTILKHIEDVIDQMIVDEAMAEKYGS